MRRRPQVLLALVGLAGLVAAACADAAADGPAGRTISVRFSHFQPEELTVRAGEQVRLTLRNDDPIEHEWIVGTEEVHAAHRTGTEAVHDEIPTEVTLSAFSSRVTSVKFEQPGEYAYICHLPGHEAYGMRGVLRVVAP